MQFGVPEMYPLLVDVFEIIHNGVHYRLEQVPEGGYFASVPELLGCLSEGETLDEAMANIREAMELYLESSDEDGLPVPEHFRSLIARAS
jgi:predicted RNase H-like HicB family nuclease